MLTVHHLNNSRSQRVLWLLEELGAEYEIVRHERDKQTMLAPPSLKAVHPLGKSPVIVDGELTLAETGPIMEYILDKYGEGTVCGLYVETDDATGLATRAEAIRIGGALDSGGPSSDR